MKTYVITVSINNCGDIYAENWGIYSSQEHVMKARCMHNFDDQVKKRIQEALADKDFFTLSHSWKENHIDYDMEIECLEVDGDLSGLSEEERLDKRQVGFLDAIEVLLAVRFGLDHDLSHLQQIKDLHRTTRQKQDIDRLIRQDSELKESIRFLREEHDILESSRSKKNNGITWEMT